MVNFDVTTLRLYDQVCTLNQSKVILKNALFGIVGSWLLYLILTPLCHSYCLLGFCVWVWRQPRVFQPSLKFRLSLLFTKFRTQSIALTLNDDIFFSRNFVRCIFRTRRSIKWCWNKSYMRKCVIFIVSFPSCDLRIFIFDGSNSVCPWIFHISRRFSHNLTRVTSQLSNGLHLKIG